MKVTVNIGSGGQPRAGDSRSCDVLLHDNGVESRRVVYPVEKTVKQFYAISEHDRLATWNQNAI